MIVYNLKPGELLPSERTLADQLGVSRASLHQALVMLKEQTWVETSEREGTRVGNALTREEVDPRAQSIQLLTDMCAVRGVIEPWVLRRAATPDKQKNISYLKRVLNETSRSNRSERLKSMDDLFFHQAIALTSCSSIHLFLAEVTQDMQQDYFDYSRNELYVGDEIDHEVIAHHAAMVRHIEACEPEQAADWQKEHTRVFKSAYANSSKM
jgi:GntR family transcriptional repressor for pyruvate dehydrogenase complex